MNVVLHVGNKDSEPANSFTDREYDLLLNALAHSMLMSPNEYAELNALHTKLLFNRLNFVKPNTAVTHADSLGEVREICQITE